jgi:hypothetical protein
LADSVRASYVSKNASGRGSSSGWAVASSVRGTGNRPHCSKTSRIAFFLSLSVVRVPAVYLGSAFLAFLSDLAEHGINNLHGFNSDDGSIPPAGTSFSIT